MHSFFKTSVLIGSLTAIFGTVGCGPKQEDSNAATPRPDYNAIIDPATVTVADAIFTSGKEAYTQACHACHGGDGMGMPGMQPALVGSEKLAGDPYVVIEWVLRGSNMMEGQPSQWPVMMPPHNWLSDDKIAAIISYSRKEFGEGATPISPEMVKLVRDNI